jgi:hypothetical protein
VEGLFLSLPNLQALLFIGYALRRRLSGFVCAGRHFRRLSLALGMAFMENASAVQLAVQQEFMTKRVQMNSIQLSLEFCFLACVLLWVSG